MLVVVGSLAIVDDSETDLVLARAALGRSALGWHLHALVGPDGYLAFVEAVRTGEQGAPDVVLMDVNMPGRSGFDVIEMTYREPIWPTSTRFVMFTNSDNPKDRDRAAELGVGFQVKPLGFSEYVHFLDTLGAE